MFRRNADGTLRFESAPLAAGRMTADGIQYHITDHLGSVRVVIDGATGNVLEASDFSAFGDRTDVTSIVQSGLGQVVPGGSSDVSLRHHFSGKEDQVTDFSVPLSDFGARHYAPHLSRWMVPDPMSEKYYDISPYVYCANDPVGVVDIGGRDTVLVIDRLSRPEDRGGKGTSYTASIYVIKEGIVSNKYRGSSYPNSISNTDNRTNYNTLKEGEMPYNNKYGHKGGTVKGLNIVDEQGERNAPAIDPDGNEVTATLINVHSGASDNGNYNSRGSHGCITIHPDDANDFFSNFNWTNKKGTTGNSSGILILIRDDYSNTKIKEILGIH